MICGHSSQWRSTAKLRAPLLSARCINPKSSTTGYIPRLPSPVRGFSTLMTSAPSSLSKCVAMGPDKWVEKSMILSGESLRVMFEAPGDRMVAIDYNHNN